MLHEISDLRWGFHALATSWNTWTLPSLPPFYESIILIVVYGRANCSMQLTFALIIMCIFCSLPYMPSYHLLYKQYKTKLTISAIIITPTTNNVRTQCSIKFSMKLLSLLKIKANTECEKLEKIQKNVWVLFLWLTLFYSHDWAY